MPVTRFEITLRRPVAGAPGYEELKGRLHFAIDPLHAANRRITDVELAPRDAQGRVTWDSDVSILLPVDRARCSGRVLLDVVNRGNTVAVPNFNRATRPAFGPGSDPNPPVDVGDGFLMTRGWVVISCGWQGDLPRVPGLIGMRTPEARDAQGRPLRGRIYTQLQSTGPGAVFLLSDRGHVPYPAADLEEADALLTVRDQPDGPATTIPRSRWRFARVDGGRVVPDADHIHLDGGIETGRLYQITYTAVGAPVQGLAMAALRDSVAWLKHGGAEAGNPAPGRLRWAYGYGRSQTGRLLRTLIYEDLNQDEQGREALDGVIANVAGGMRGEFNQRFGQHSKDRNNMMAHLFPFTDQPQAEPETGAKDALHARLDARGSRLRVYYTNSSAEYHRGDASLIHTDPDGTRDVAPGPYTRVYHFAGTEHGLGIWPPTDAQPAPADPDRAGRALAEPPRRGRLLGAAARLPGEPRPLGGGGRRAAAEPSPAPGRRHRGAARPPRARLRADPRRPLPAPQPAAAPARLERAAAHAGQALRLPRLRGGRRRQRDRRHRPAGDRGAAGRAHRLEPAAPGHRRRRAAPDVRGRRASPAAESRRARGHRRSAPVGRGALRIARGVSRPRAAGRGGPGPRGLHAGGRRAALGGRGRALLGSLHSLTIGDPMYDLLLKGGTVLDPSMKLDGRQDVAVQGGAIARVAPDIAETEAARVIDVRGRTVVPGLIDLHAHVFEGINRTGVNPDLGGVYAGVTTIVDAGSAGAATFAGFPRHILPHCHTEVIPFLHICQTGLATMPDIIAESSINLDDTLKVVDQHKHLIRGIKARMVSPALEIMGMEMPKLAKRAAKESGVKLMVHIGDTEKRYDPKVIRSLLPILEKGDILTHYFTANPGGVLDGNGKLVPEVKEAADRGVWFDTAHGRMNFSFDVGRRVIEQGVLPHCISTDLTVPGRVMTVHSMTEMMTRFLGLGFTLPQVVTMCTANPAKAAGVDDRLGSLAVGRQADISVLDIRPGDWMVYDVLGAGLRVDRAVVPFVTVKKGRVFTPDWGPRTWGWEPDRALPAGGPIRGGCC